MYVCTYTHTNTYGYIGVCICAQLCLSLCDPMDYSPPGSSVHGVSQQEDWSGLLFPAPGDLPLPGAEPMSLDSPALQADFLITVPPGKPQVCLHVNASVYVCIVGLLIFLSDAKDI